jgi:Zn-finger nucleic acid-binding protein
MRWKMCPKCGVKMSMEVSETDLQIFHCHVCKQSFIEFSSELLKYVEQKANENNKDINEFIDDLFKILDKMELDKNESKR